MLHSLSHGHRSPMGPDLINLRRHPVPFERHNYLEAVSSRSHKKTVPTAGTYTPTPVQQFIQMLLITHTERNKQEKMSRSIKNKKDVLDRDIQEPLLSQSGVKHFKPRETR